MDGSEEDKTLALAITLKSLVSEHLRPPSMDLGPAVLGRASDVKGDYVRSSLL